MKGMFLTHEEIVELTGRHRRDAQKLAMRHMGIEHKIRPDGSVAVLRAHVEEVFGYKADKPKKGKDYEPDFEALKRLVRGVK